MNITVRRRWHYHALRLAMIAVYPWMLGGVVMATFHPDKLTLFWRVLCGLAIVPLFFLRPKVEHVPSLQGARVPVERPGGDGRAIRHVIKLVDTTIDGPIRGSDNPRPPRIEVR
jgi:hypothetical protein